MQPDTRARRNPTSVWIVEDDPDYRETVRQLLDGSPDLACPHAFESGEDVLEFLNEHFAPEVMIVDLELSTDMKGIEVMSRVRNVAHATHFVVLTGHDDNEYIMEAICAGARGYLLKDAATHDEIVQAVRDVQSGGAPMTKAIARRVLDFFTQRAAPQWEYDLTEREHGVLECMVKGMSKKAMAKELHLSVHTVDSHIRNIYGKLHVNSRSSAVAKAVKERLVRE